MATSFRFYFQASVSEGTKCHHSCEAFDELLGGFRGREIVIFMSWPDISISTSLAAYLDKKLVILLRDGRTFLGKLRSFDQFANVALEGACERVIVGDLYCDIPLGLYVIRGENVVLLGEMELDKEVPPSMIRVSEAEIKRAQKVKKDASRLKESMRKRMDFLDYD